MSKNTSEKDSIKMTAPKLKARDIHIIRRAALHLAFLNCPLCGMPNNLEALPFTLVFDNGATIDFDRVDAALDFCHLFPRELGGSNSPENLFVGHHRCNLKQAKDTIEQHCGQMKTALTATQIRELVATAHARASEMIEKRAFHADIQAMAQKLLTIGKPERTGKQWTKIIQAA